MKLKYQIAIVGTGILLAAGPLLLRRYIPNFVREFFTDVASPFNLAIFRIIFFLLVLFSFSIDNVTWFGSLSRDLIFPPTGLQFILVHLPISESFAQVASIALILACLACILGVFTRTSIIICLVLSLYVLGLPQFFGKINHYHHLIWFMAILAVSPCADVLSFDGVWKSWQVADLGVTAPPKPSVWYSLPLRFVCLLMGVIYFSAGFWKFWTAGYHWAWSDNLRNIMYNKWMELPGWFPIFRVDQYPLFYKVSGLITILFELSFIFLILGRRVRFLAPLGGVAFHSMTNLLMKIWFWNLLGCYAAFVNWSALFKSLGRRLFPADAYLLYDGNCKLCRRTIASFRTFDLCERVVYVNALDQTALAARGLRWLEENALMRQMHFVVGRDVFVGFAAYREWIKRLPCFWLALPFLYLPPVISAGERIYRRIAESRRCSVIKPDRAQLSPSRRSYGVAVIGSLLVYVTILSAVAKLQSWPLALYPTFEDMDKPELSILSMTVQDRAGAISEVIPIKDARLKKLSEERLMGLQNKLLTVGDENERRRRLQAFWWLLVRENPPLSETATVKFYRDTVSSLPEDRNNRPLRHELLWEMRVETPALATR